jgi:maleate cis-trans isomerase
MMTHRIGILLPSSNTVVETELSRALPKTFQIHVGRLLLRSVDKAGWQTQDADIDRQAELLGTAKVELVLLLQTSASFFTDGYDAAVTRRMSEAAGVPAVTSAQAIGRALSALGVRRIALLSPYSAELAERGKRYFAAEHGLDVVLADRFGATMSSEAVSQIGTDEATAALDRADRPEIEAFVIGGGNFPTLPSIAAWEARLGKPVITTNQASIWAIFQALAPSERLEGYGRLLA